MEKKLFLATIDLLIHHYPDRQEKERVTRIVWATDSVQAKDLIKADMTTNDPYCRSQHVDSVEITEALGSPIEGF